MRLILVMSDHYGQNGKLMCQVIDTHVMRALANWLVSLMPDVLCML